MTQTRAPESRQPALFAAARRNRAAILAFEFLWGLAMPFVQVTTVLPGYLQHLGAANVWIGLAPALYQGVLALVQPVAAYALPAGPGRLGRMRRIYAGGAVAYVLLGAAILIGLRSPAWGLAAALLAAGTFALATGLGDPTYIALAVAAVSPEGRGRFFGLRIVCLGLGGIAGGALAERSLGAAVAPTGFGLCFLAGGLLYAFSTLSMAFYRDAPVRESARPAGFRAFIADRMLARFRQPEFRAFAVAIAGLGLAASAFPFLSLLLRDRLGEGERFLGLLGAVLMAGNLAHSWLLGVVTDRWGSRASLAVALVAIGLGTAGCLLFRERALLLACYFLASAWMPAQFVSATDLGLRLAPEAPPAEIFATMMAVMAPARILGPVLAGAVIDQAGYVPALLAANLCAVIALVALPFTRASGAARSTKPIR
jgi:MFS family permease